MKFLVIVDVQHDFVDGSLGSDEAFDAYMRIRDYLQNVDENYCVLFTQDTHNVNYLDTFEGKRLPVKHCIKGEHGWKIMRDLRAEFDNAPYVIHKDTFGSFKLPVEMQEILNFNEEVDEIEICGLCTDICVISNALMTKAQFYNSTPISCDATCCAGVTPEKHVAALEVMKSCQIIVKE